MKHVLLSHPFLLGKRAITSLANFPHYNSNLKWGRGKLSKSKVGHHFLPEVITRDGTGERIPGVDGEKAHTNVLYFSSKF